MRKLIIITLVLFLALPLSFIVTVIIHPVWRSFENVTGIEAFGHSGPAEWCYWFDYGLISLVSLIGLYILDDKNKESK